MSPWQIDEFVMDDEQFDELSISIRSETIDENDGAFLINEQLTTNCDMPCNGDSKTSNSEKNASKKHHPSANFRLKASMPKIRVEKIKIINMKSPWEKFENESKSSEEKQEIDEKLDDELASVNSSDNSCVSSLASSLSKDDSSEFSIPQMPSKWFSKAVVDIKRSSQLKSLNRSRSENDSKMPSKPPIITTRRKSDSAVVVIAQHSSPPTIIRVPSKSEFEVAEEEEAVDIIKGRIRRHRKRCINSEVITTPVVGVVLPCSDCFDKIPTPTDAEEGSTQSSFFRQKKNKFAVELKYIYGRISLLNCFRKPKKHKLERATGCLT